MPADLQIILNVPTERLNPPEAERLHAHDPNRWNVPVSVRHDVRDGQPGWLNVGQVGAITGLTRRQLTTQCLVRHGWLPAPVACGLGGRLAWNESEVRAALRDRLPPPPREGTHIYIVYETEVEVEFRRGRVVWIRGDLPEQSLEDAARLIGGRWVWLDEYSRGGHTVRPWGEW